jgi:hypothetical protein
MIGFLIRKTIYDLWDNLFKIVILNMGFIALSAIPIFLPRLAAQFVDAPSLEIALSAFGILLCSVYLSAASFVLKTISDYGSFGFGDFFRAFKTSWPAGLVMGFFIFFLFIIFYFIIPFYFSIESGIGLILGAVVFWMSVFAVLTFQYFFTVYVRLGATIKKAFRKSMIISLDNSGLSLFLLLHNIGVLILSIVFAFMFPGPVGVLLYIDEALRLRLLKYDWLDANPGSDRRKIPWDVLLIEEREKTGERSLKNFIFPWKD